MDNSFVLFYEKCRLCLDKAGLSNIFKEETTEHDEGTKESLDLPQAIYSCTGVKICRKDNLPSKICENCLDIVVKARELKLLAQKNDSHLKMLFTASDDENDEIPDKTPRMMIPDSLIDSALFMADVTEADRSTSSSELRKSMTETEKRKKISIRKDLFETSPVSSSTSVKLKLKCDDNTKNTRKRIKSEDGTEYVCETCSKKYETLKKLYLHQRTHNRSYACPLDVCGKRFATKGDLEKHVRTHTGVKPFVCDICDKSFAQNGTLKTHKETVHDIFTFNEKD